MEFKKNTLKTYALTVCIGLALTGCGSQQTKPASAMSASEKAQLAQVKDKATSLLESAQQAFSAAEKNQVSLYSQIYFPDAKRQLSKLKEMHKEFNPNKAGLFSSGYSLDEIEEQASLVNQTTQKAQKTKQLITLHFKDILDNQEYIESLDLSKFESTYKGLQSDVKRLFKDLERAGQFQGLEEDRLKVQNDLRAFEVSVIKEQFYNSKQKELDELPEGTLPVTYAEARKRLSALSKTIESTPRAMDTIKLRQKEAIKALTRAQNTLREINWIDENTSRGLEHIVLKYHKPMDRAFPNVLKEDHSELLFEDQVSKYSYLVTNLKSTIQREVGAKDEATIKAEAQKIADEQSAKLKERLSGEHNKELSEREREKQEAINKAVAQAQARFDEEKKQLKDTHKQKVDSLVAERNKLQLDFEQVSLQLSDVKQKQQYAEEQLRLTKQTSSVQQASSAQPTTSKSKSASIAQSKTSAPKRNSTAQAPAAPVVEQPTEVIAPPVGSQSFDYEIEEVEL